MEWQTLAFLIITTVSASLLGKTNGHMDAFTLTGSSLILALQRSEKFVCWTGLC